MMAPDGGNPNGIYDFVLAGGGAAGLSLALALAESPLRDRSILILEREAKLHNDRTWCYWAAGDDPFDSIRRCAWPELRLVTENAEEHRLNMGPYRYQMVRGLDFYNAARQRLAQHPNVTQIQADVQAVVDGPEAVQVQAGGRSYHARWAFDSRFVPGSISTSGPRDVVQHFRGWEIETEREVFDPRAATLFDLRAPQPEGLAFFYVLPFSPQQALVEYTLFSKHQLPEEDYAHALRGYLDKVLGVDRYSVTGEEAGQIPMTAQRFQRRLGRRIMAIGTRGGRVKPSTGYAFARIQADSLAIVRSLIEKGQPFHRQGDSARHRWYDSLLLGALSRSDPRLREIFTALFTRNPLPRVLRFLDQSTTLAEEIRIIGTLPPEPFLRSMFTP